MNDLEALAEVLQSGVDKHGERQLTNVWLLNIVRDALATTTEGTEVDANIGINP